MNIKVAAFTISEESINDTISSAVVQWAKSRTLSIEEVKFESHKEYFHHIFIPPANFVCRGYTVFTLSVRPSVRPSVRASVRP